MALNRTVWLVVTPLVLAFAAGGCVNKEKQELVALREQYNDLSNQNQDLQSQLAQSQARETQVLAQLSDKTAELDAAKAEVQTLKTQKVSAPPVQSAQGWEAGLSADRVTVGSDILFASGKASLTSAGKAALNKIAADIRKSYANMPVRVYGYTDTDPIKRSKWKDNLELSSMRAMAVTRYLASKGIKAKLVETIGMGEHHPVGTSKAKSRRVEIIAIKNK